MSAQSSVWKFPIRVDDTVTVSMPKGAEVLHAAEQDGRVCLWARVDPKQAESEVRQFRVAGTGHPHAEGAYVGTVHCGSLVLHVFELATP